jgi:hypothetical protein
MCISIFEERERETERIHIFRMLFYIELDSFELFEMKNKLNLKFYLTRKF